MHLNASCRSILTSEIMVYGLWIFIIYFKFIIHHGFCSFKMCRSIFLIFVRPQILRFFFIFFIFATKWSCCGLIEYLIHIFLKFFGFTKDLDPFYIQKPKPMNCKYKFEHNFSRSFTGDLMLDSCFRIRDFEKDWIFNSDWNYIFIIWLSVGCLSF